MSGLPSVTQRGNLAFMFAPFRRFFARRAASRTDVEEIIRAPRDRGPAATEMEITPFFANLQDYVGIAEELPLKRLPSLLNAWFEAATTAIDAENGTLDKFIGDVVVAMFGAPVPSRDHALRACVAAVRCQHAVGELRARLQRDADSWPERVRELRARIGLHSGLAIIGNMGSKTNFNYTMMGDTVNLAARVESAAKTYAVGVLCTGATQQACESAAPGCVLFRRLGKIVAKGRTNAVELFEVAALGKQATDQLRDCLATFEAGLGCYQQSDWAGAIRYFEKSATLERDQHPMPGHAPNPSALFLQFARAAGKGREAEADSSDSS
jgi:adenylate cyclase